MTLSSDALADAAVNRPTIVSPKNVLTPLERAAVSAAAQAAVTEQDSLAPLFANLGAAVSSSNLPAKLQAAIAQVLAQQTSLDQNLGGGDIKTAFQKSGIFLEASLAAGSVSAGGVPDLKAALIVLRQTLQSALGSNATSARRLCAPARMRRCHTSPLRACAVFVSISMSGNRSAAARLGPPKSRAGRPAARIRWRRARRRTFGRCDPNLSAGALQELGNRARSATSKDGRART